MLSGRLCMQSPIGHELQLDAIALQNGPADRDDFKDGKLF